MELIKVDEDKEFLSEAICSQTNAERWPRCLRHLCADVARKPS